MIRGCIIGAALVNWEPWLLIVALIAVAVLTVAGQWFDGQFA